MSCYSLSASNLITVGKVSAENTWTAAHAPEIPDLPIRDSTRVSLGMSLMWPEIEHKRKKSVLKVLFLVKCYNGTEHAVTTNTLMAYGLGLCLNVCYYKCGKSVCSWCDGLSDRSFMVEREREMFYLMTHSTHFIYGYMASDIWLRTILIVRKETRCHHIGYSYRLTARVLLYAPSHRQDNT